MDNISLLARLDLIIPLVRVANRDITLLLSDVLKECGPNERPANNFYDARQYLSNTIYSLEVLKRSIQKDEGEA